MKIVIAGASGFIGSHIASFFKEKGNELILLTRHPSKREERYWNPENLEIDSEILEGADVSINLCGESIFGRWSDDKLERIRKSRLIPTQFFVKTLSHLKNPPKLHINASAIGYYGECPERVIESQPAGDGYLAAICRDWEESVKFENLKIRKVFARFGIVLGEDEGMLKKLVPAFKSGLGGVVGSGNQLMSWIAIDDLVRAIEHVIGISSIYGPVNMTSPNPVSNKEFTQTMGRLLARPTLFSTPMFMIKTIFGKGAEMFLTSSNAYPEVLIKTGFQFQYPHLEDALKKYLRI